jgi:hypothetical protein
MQHRIRHPSTQLHCAADVADYSLCYEQNTTFTALLAHLSR